MKTSNLFLEGDLHNSKIIIRETEHVIIYFQFKEKGFRSISQIKSFLLAKDIKIKK